MGSSVAAEVDRVVVVVAAIVLVVAAAQLRVLVATALGDDTAQRAGRLWSLGDRVDRTGTLLLPALLALATGVAIGWAARPPLRPAALTPWRRVLLAFVEPALALATAAVALAVRDPGVGGVGDPAVAVAATAVATAVFWSLPVPPLPFGVLLGGLLRGEAAARWGALARRTVTPYGMAVGVVLVVTGLGDQLLVALSRSP